MSGSDDLQARDARTIWHPYTQHGLRVPPLPVVGAKASWLELADGRRVLDGISSWWTCLHGHGHPRIVEAIRDQAARLDHVLFAGATHEPAVELAETLLAMAPEGLSRVFYSDDGSTAVEVGLKVVRQAWVQRGQPSRDTFVALEHGYHGDTFGAMSVGDPEPFFRPYAPLLFGVRRVPANAGALRAALADLGDRAAGVIVEPLIQGAGGMRMHDVEFLHTLGAECSARGVPWIADEVMTGFGRTGAVFACELAGVRPDVLCLSKGLTGGVLPLAATLVTESLFEAFLADDRARMFFHGHSFTANPIGCAAALASMRLLREEATPARLTAIGELVHAALLAALPAGAPVRNVRRLGGVVAFDVVAEEERSGYFAGDPARRIARAVAAGVLLRSLGDVCYALPPASTTDREAGRIGAVLASFATPE